MLDLGRFNEGRQSIDAVVVATTLASLDVLGNTFLVDLGRATAHLVSGQGAQSDHPVSRPPGTIVVRSAST